jgi:hypothetical protein
MPGKANMRLVESKNSKKFWGDCRSDQFVYGNKYGENDKHFYAPLSTSKCNSEVGSKDFVRCAEL